MKLLTILLFITFTANSQSKLFSKKDLAVYGLMFLSGSADGINQAIAHHHLGRGQTWVDYDNSWKNKYKDFPTDKRDAYFLSSSLLAFTTDAYHFTRFLDRSSMLASLCFADFKKKDWWKKLIISAAFNRAGFYIFYNIIYK